MIEGTIQDLTGDEAGEPRLSLATPGGTTMVRLDRYATTIWRSGDRVAPDALVIGQRVAVQIQQRDGRDVAGTITVLRMVPAAPTPARGDQPTRGTTVERKATQGQVADAISS